MDRGNGEPTGLGDGGSDDGDLGEMAVDGVEKHAAKKGPDVLRTSLRALEKVKSLIQSLIHSLSHSFASFIDLLEAIKTRSLNSLIHSFDSIHLIQFIHSMIH